MAIKNVVVSDLSGSEVSEDQAATIVVTDHPSLSGAVELDTTRLEAGKIQAGKIDLVSLLIYDGGSKPRRVVMDTKAFNGLFKAGTDVEGALKGARKSSAGTTKRRSSSKGERIDYLAPDNFGKLHRGRVTDAEAELVKGNREQASKNRKRQTGSPIDWSDAAEKKRYGL